MHIAHLARAENALLASPLDDKLRFVFREHVRGAVVLLRQLRLPLHAFARRAHHHVVYIRAPGKIPLDKSPRIGLDDRARSWADGAGGLWGRRAFSMLSAGWRRSALWAIRWKRSRRSCHGRISVLTSRP